MRRGRIVSLTVASAIALAASACTDTPTDPDTTTATTGPMTTTTMPPTTTTEAPTTALPGPTTTAVVTDADDYPVEDGYVVETIASGIDAGTGGLSVDGEGNLYTSDFGYPDHDGRTIFRITEEGEVAPFATSELMSSLTGSAFGPDGTLYQSSFGNNRVFTVSPDGTVDLLTEEISGPTGIVTTNDGRLFVESCRRNQVFEVFDDGSVAVIAEGVGMNCPNGMTMDAEGNLYVVNFSTGFMQRITPDGDIEAIYRFPSGNAHIVHLDGSLFVTARVDNRVLRYDIATQAVTVIAGTGESGFEDGPGGVATIARPNAIALGPNGTLYINHGGGEGRNDPTTVRAIRRSP